MGNRISVQFEQRMEEWSGPTQRKMKYVRSVAIFHHNAGEQFANFVFDWFKGFMKMAIIEKHHERWTPHNIALACASEVGNTYKYSYKKSTAPEPSIYLGKDEYDGDNSDNGNFVIDMDECTMTQEKVEYV